MKATVCCLPPTTAAAVSLPDNTKSGRLRFQCAVFHAARVLPLLVLFLAGCKSTSEFSSGSHSTRMASVVIKGHSRADITLATTRVFVANGYEKTPLKAADLFFEKQGTRMNTLVYGDWSAKPVWVRVKVYLRDLGAANGMLLDCDAYMVVERGDRHFEEEHKLTKLHRGTYQELLDRVSYSLR